jgi:hypothetical protein
MRNLRHRIKVTGPTADELADIEEDIAERYTDMGFDDADFMMADALERRRLAALNREEDAREREELKAWRNSIRRKPKPIISQEKA